MTERFLETALKKDGGNGTGSNVHSSKVEHRRLSTKKEVPQLIALYEISSMQYLDWKLNWTRNSWNRMVHHTYVWRIEEHVIHDTSQAWRGEKARLDRAFSNWPLRTQLKRSEGADRDRCSGISISRCTYLFEYLLSVRSVEISRIIRMVFLTIWEEKLCY